MSAVKGSPINARRHIAVLCVLFGVLGTTSASASLRAFTAPVDPGRIVRGADGALWFTINGGVATLTAAGQPRSIQLPGALRLEVLGITAAPDGAVWATESTGPVARIGPDGRVTETPPTGGMPTGIAVGPDGAVWFTDSLRGRVTRVGDGDSILETAPASNALLETALPSVLGSFSRMDPASPTELLTGPDRALWFLELSPGRVGRMNPAEAPTFVGLPAGAAAYPTALAVGQDGALWITEAGANQIARLTTDGVVREFQIPSPGAEPRAIAQGADGAMWFTEYGTDRLGRVDMSGHVTEYQLPSGAAPYGITAGADGAMWFTMRGLNKIGRMTTDTVAMSAGRARCTRSTSKPRRTPPARRYSSPSARPIRASVSRPGRYP
jgi:virginiamycin B lyase